MKMKLNDIFELNNTVKTIIDNAELKIDAVFIFKLLGIMKNLENPISNFQVVREEKIREYGVTDEKTGSIHIPDDDKEAIGKFLSDINRVCESEVDVHITKLKAHEVFDSGIPSDYLIGLYNIIEE